ncbi:MAG: hypothetical protein JST18_08500 [Bacteroidetes bacterium]|nr:hypothetical protein [Bacteroidota bacterium]
MVVIYVNIIYNLLRKVNKREVFMAYTGSGINPPPAFGFQNTYYNGEAWFRQYGTELKDRNICKKNGNQVKPAKECVSDWNWSKVRGYIPLLGICDGITNVIFATRFTREELPNKYFYIARGIIEIAGLGILLLLVDAVATAYLTYRGIKQD